MSDIEQGTGTGGSAAGPPQAPERSQRPEEGAQGGNPPAGPQEPREAPQEAPEPKGPEFSGDGIVGDQGEYAPEAVEAAEGDTTTEEDDA